MAAGASGSRVRERRADPYPIRLTVGTGPGDSHPRHGRHAAWVPSLDENLQRWEEGFDWSSDGDEWSEAWGGAESQWRWCILPRISPFLPTGTLLEIAPGRGRWTRFLVERCRRLIGIDLAPTCVEKCRERFSTIGHAEFHATDGRSLAAVADGAVDFAFTFDSLVHVQQDVIASYLRELRRTLAPGGCAFIHHSNLGSYRRHYAIASRIPRGRRWLAHLGLVEGWYHWRSPDVGMASVRAAAEAAGLVCTSQEAVNWGTRRMIDGFTVVTQPGSRWRQPYRLVENPGFMDEARRARSIAPLYPPPPADQPRI
jgi:SAM-dependent methyltransferase